MIRPIPTRTTELFHSRGKAECILFLVVEVAQIIIGGIKLGREVLYWSDHLGQFEIADSKKCVRWVGTWNADIKDFWDDVDNFSQFRDYIIKFWKTA